MKHSPTLVCALFCTIVSGTSAEAQKAGTYYGTSADGQFLDFTVGTDTNTNSLAVLGAGINFDAVCSGGNPNMQSSWGLGFTQDIVARKATVLFSGQDIYVTANLVFSSNGNTVTGNITTRSVAFAPSTGAPTKAEYCISPRQAFTATLSTTTVAAPAPGVSIHYPPAK
jgi:hypothetical protein